MAKSPLRRVKVLLLAILVWSPALFTGHLVWQKAVDVGCWDVWENGPLLQKWHDGQLTWQDLYAAQIQHRIVVPRLLIIALTQLSGGDFRWEQYFTYLVLILSSWLIWMLIHRTLGGSPWRWAFMGAAALLIFSPIHYQILFWGSSMWSALPVPCLLGCLLLGTRRSPGTGAAGEIAISSRGAAYGRFAVCVLLAETATHSFAHGLAIWPVVLLLILYSAKFGPWRQRLIFCAVWTLIAAVTVGCYFTNFINVAFHAYNFKPGDDALSGSPSMLQWKNIEAALEFFLAFIGSWFSRSPFADHPLAAAHLLGIATLALFVTVSGTAALWKPARKHWPAILPWFLLGVYVIGVGLMVSKRGSDIGVHRAVTPRYLVVSQYLWISIWGMGLTLATKVQAPASKHDPSAPVAQSSSFICAVLMAAFAMAQIPVWQYGLHVADIWYHARRQAQALFLLLPSFKEHPRLISMKPLDKSFEYCLDSANRLSKMGLLKTQPLASADLKWFKPDKAPSPREKADVTSVASRPDGVIEVLGYARFGIGNPVDAVLISQGGRVIGLGQPMSRPLLRIYALDYEFSNLEEAPLAGMYPWKADLSWDTLAPGGPPLELWALDVAAHSISRLHATLKVDLEAKRVERVE